MSDKTSVLNAFGYVVQDGKVTYWNCNMIRVMTDDGTTVRLDFAADHALTFVGEARLGALRMLCEMGLKAIDIKPATPMAANVKEEPAT